MATVAESPSGRTIFLVCELGPPGWTSHEVLPTTDRRAVNCQETKEGPAPNDRMVAAFLQTHDLHGSPVATLGP